MGNFMTHEVVFIGKVGTDYETARHRFSCSLRIDEVGDEKTAVIISTGHDGPMKYGSGPVYRLSSLGKLEGYDLISIHSLWKETNIGEVYVVEFISYDKKVSMNEWGDINLGPTIEERLELRLRGGWEIVGERTHAFSDILVSIEDLNAIRREIKLDGLLG